MSGVRVTKSYLAKMYHPCCLWTRGESLRQSKIQISTSKFLGNMSEVKQDFHEKLTSWLNFTSSVLEPKLCSDHTSSYKVSCRIM